MLQKLEETLEPLLYHYKQARKPQEPFGDFCARVGFEALRSYSSSFVGHAAEQKLPQVRIQQKSLDSVQAIADQQVRIQAIIKFACMMILGIFQYFVHVACFGGVCCMSSMQDCVAVVTVIVSSEAAGDGSCDPSLLGMKLMHRQLQLIARQFICLPKNLQIILIVWSRGLLIQIILIVWSRGLLIHAQSMYCRLNSEHMSDSNAVCCRANL